VTLVGLDTATAATTAAVLLPDGTAVEARDDLPPGARGAHGSRVLPLLAQAMERAGVGWGEVERIAVGVGPGGFTGLRIGVATARGLAQARGLALVGVSSLRALALPQAGPVLAAIDARRGEVFAAAWDADGLLLAPAALRPQELAARLAAAPLGGPSAASPPLAVGDGAVRFRAVLEDAGATVPDDSSPAHRLSAVAVCRLGAAGEPVDREGLLPDYLREPDAVPFR